ncbi:dynamin family protein [Priestia megaterium]|uniref:dynamin family protein n=1 Tax=Priestia megaterium TaxID=1404 RepID=UPI0024532A50|nr:dynamin family protein [Priestia megaterium]MDH3143348.1 dynamin family protein [Priestia megaterium]
MGKVSVKHQENLRLEASLFHLHKQFQAAGDEQQAAKAIQLLKKWVNGEFVVAFCGHFSAGKSSMINELMGQAILPASPIPTSANLVSVKAGDEHATVYYRKQPPVRYEAPYEYEQIKQFAVDGDEVESIHLSIDTDAIPKNVVVMDTPGIDSTDDAHRVSTESALHLADVIFYVMDYNHVQAELNLQFAKQLQEANKTLYLIVNQIDKHQEDQLTFQAFKESVETSFLKWNVRPEGIFYTSLKEPTNRHNDLLYVKSLLLAMMTEKENRHQHIQHAMQMLIDDHLAFIEDQEEEKLTIHDELRHKLTLENHEINKQQKEQLLEKEAKIRRAEKQLAETYQQETGKILSNANLTPYEMREKARLFLETTKPDFKVGLLFAKKKTEEVKKERLTLFFDDMKERAASQLQWHLQQYVQELVKNQNLTDPDLIRQVQQFEIPLEPHDLIETVKAGATINGDYVLTYAKDVADHIKKKATRLLYELYAQIEQSKIEQDEVKREKIYQHLQECEVFEEAYTSLQEMKAKLARTKALLQSLQQTDDDLTAEDTNELSYMLQEEYETGIMKAEEKQEAVSEQQLVSQPEEAVHETGTEKVLQDVSAVLEQLRSFGKLDRFINRLQEKRKKLSNQTFTVALFGAFSAGKSSFANALIGERLLPVSPNPTTATINKIMPPTEKRPHKTAVVQMKTNEQMIQDLNGALKLFHHEVESIDEALTIIPTLQATEELQLHLSFLQAVEKGYGEVKQHIGSEVVVDTEGFHDYVAKEEKACFVQFINLYYDCEFTRLGIKLVDTPGADSINARHTGVAFEYIKNADAILFVTYYNHAFSKADREFLIQLGRVKDVFALDKMFFLVNAADLASSDTELQLVQTYVKEQLEQYGIRFPRLYPVSSLQALQNHEDKMFLPFKNAFYRFINYELPELAIQSVYADFEQILAVANEMKQVQTKSEVDKKRYIQSLHIKNEQVAAKLHEIHFEYEQQQFDRELEELLFYVKKRLFVRYDDFFKEAFSPANLRDDRGEKQKQLCLCLQELLTSISFDATQEVRATTLRIEKYIVKLIEDWHRMIITKLQRYEPTFTPTLNSLEPPNGSEVVTSHQFDENESYQKELSLYKNNKSFFEKNEKVKLHAALLERIKPDVNHYIAKEETALHSHYTHLVNQYVLAHKQSVSEEWYDYYKQLQAAVSEEFPIQELVSTMTVLEHVLEERKGH